MASERTPLLSKRHPNGHTVSWDSNVANTENRATGSLDSMQTSINRVAEGPKDDEELPHDIDMKLLSTQYESLDYDNCENDIFMEEERAKSYSQVKKIEFARWVVMFFIGVTTGLIAAFIDIVIVYLSKLKFGTIREYFLQCLPNSCLSIPLLIWVAWNILFILIATLMCTYWAPVATGSGIPQIKCYLNGVKIPFVVRFKTLVTKVLGVIFVVCGGLSIGKEGPMIHSGAIVAAGLSQGRSSSFGCDMHIFEYFRTDTEKRDFVSGGAAAGVSAAFGAPVGGVLFSLEEGASFWNQALTWRIFFASMMSTFTLNVVQSYAHNKPWALSYSGLLNFGGFNNLDYTGAEIPIFIAMGIFGGLSGALFNHINYKLSIFRKRHVYTNYAKAIEALVVAINSTIVAFVLLYFVTDCQPLSADPYSSPLQMYCPDGQYNSMAALWFETPELTVKSLLHEQTGTYKPLTLALFAIAYFLLACWTYGVSVPSGLFIPSIVTGAAWGRLVGSLLKMAFHQGEWVDPGKFALIGAAAQLGGIVRMTISLTVIIMEATGNISFGLPIMISIMVSKWIGDLFNEGIYDIHIELASVPLLGWEPPHLSTKIFAKQVMSHPVTTLRAKEKVGRIVDILHHEEHNGFPVVTNDFDPTAHTHGETSGTLIGLVTRNQLIVLLKNKVFEQEGDDNSFTLPPPKLTTKHFRDDYPRFPRIEAVNISLDERECTMDLTPFMNPAPYAVLETTSLVRIFKLFRGLGLRHLVVINHHNEVIGIISRKDIARYKLDAHGKGEKRIEEKQISRTSEHRKN